MNASLFFFHHLSLCLNSLGGMALAFSLIFSSSSSLQSTYKLPTLVPAHLMNRSLSPFITFPLRLSISFTLTKNSSLLPPCVTRKGHIASHWPRLFYLGLLITPSNTQHEGTGGSKEKDGKKVECLS